MDCSSANQNLMGQDHLAYFLHHYLAVAQNWALLVSQSSAISGTKGSSGLTSPKSAEIERRTLEMVRAGYHESISISRHIDPLVLMLGWQILVVKQHLGGRKGQSSGKWMLRKKIPPAQGLPSGPIILACQSKMFPVSVGPAEKFMLESFCNSASYLYILL